MWDLFLHSIACEDFAYCNVENMTGQIWNKFWWQARAIVTAGLKVPTALKICNLK